MSLELSGTTPAVKGVAGSVSAPAITGDDVDTGISFPAADTIKFSAGGVEKLAITSSGLTGDGSGLTNVGGGKLIQMKHKLSSTQVSTSSSSSYTIATDLNLSITPTSATNLILGMFTLYMQNYTNGAAQTSGEVAVTDDDESTYLWQQRIRGYDYGNSGMLLTAILGGNHVKVAGNTNPRTYKVGIKNISGGGNAHGTILNGTSSDNSLRLSSVILMEIEP